jgi:putative ABC transport system permease protein
VALLGPYLMSVAELMLRWPLRLAGAPGRLASTQIRSRPRRMASALVAIALPVTFIGAISVVDSTQKHASVGQGRERLAARVVVTAPGPGLDPSIIGAIQAQPGVGPVVGLTPTTVYVPDQGNESTTAEAVSPGPLGSLLRLAVRAGSLSGFGPGDIALSQTVASSLGVRAGRTVSAYLADGTPYPARVAAIYSRSLGFADAIVPAAAGGGGHLGTSTVGEVLVGGDGPGHPEALVAQINGLAASYPGLQAATRTVANAEYEKQTSQDTYINNMLLAIVALLAGMALVNILVVATLESRAELGLIRRVGASSRQLLATAAVQAGAVTAVGVGLGVAAGAGVTSAVCRALAGSWKPYIPWGPTTAILGLVVAVSILAMVVPTAGAGQEAGS